MLTEENLHRGMAPDEARYAALRSFGGIEQTKEAYRDQRGLHTVETFCRDLRYGFRQLRQSPGFTAVAVATLALGIGANTAIFSVVYDVLLKPLPFSHPEQLVGVFEANDQAGIAENGSSYQEFEEWRKLNRSFSAMAGDQEHELTLTGRGEPTSVRVADVTPEIFSLLDATPLLGRAFLPEEGKRGAAPVAILSESLWRSRFGADPAVIGSAIDLDKRAFTVVGVMPESFQYPLMMTARHLWIPLVQDPLFGGWTTLPGGHWLRVVARLKPGVSLAQGQAEMDALNHRLAGQYRAGDPGWAIRIGSLKSEVVGKAGTALLVMLAAVGLVLLIACANVASLLLARATSRAREFAVRVALGAGRSRIVRQLLTESILLGLVGAVAGVVIAYGGARALSGLLPPGLPRIHAIRVDGWMLGFALLLSLGASLLFGLAPALFAADSSRQTLMREGGGRSGEGRGRLRVRRGLVSAEIALALVLLVGAGLLVRSFAALTSVDPGFDARRILKAEISLPRFQYSMPAQWVAFSNEVLERVQAQPGMQQAAVAVPLPLADGFVNLAFQIEKGRPLPTGRTRTADYVAVSPDYFRVLGIPLLRGRYFSRQDALSTPRVAIISDALARLYFPDRDPLGSRLIFGFPPDGNVTREIVGVVRDVRDAALNRPPGPIMYVPFAQAPFWGGCLIVKTTAGADTVAHAIR
jgi:putative ABC transport system permease protein